MPLTAAWTELRYHPEHARLWQYQGRFAAIRAGRQSGKTELASRKLVSLLPQKMWHGKPGMFAYIAPTVPQAKRIIWERLKALCHPSWIAKIHESELYIKSVWGSYIYVCGFDKPARIEGTPWDFVFVDESSDIKPHAVNRSIVPALSQTRGILWRGGIPKRKGVGAVEFRQICNDPALGYEFFYWSAADLLTDEEILEQKQKLGDKDYREQISGLDVEQGGSAFYAFSVAGDPNNTFYPYGLFRDDPGNIVASKLTQYDPGKCIIVGSDFNVSPMAWCLCHIHDGCICVFDEIWLTDTNTKATLDYLWQKYGDHKGGFLFMGDAAGRQRRSIGSTASMSDYILIKNDQRFAQGPGGVNINYPMANPRIKDRLASCNAMLKNAMGQRRVFINPQCIHLIEDLQVRGMDDTGDPIKAGEDYGHISDAFGYVVHGLFPVHLSTEGIYPVNTNTSAIQLSVVR